MAKGTMKLIHKITLLQASLYFDTLDSKHIISGYFRKVKEKQFLIEFNQLFSSKEVSLQLTDQKYKLYIYNKAYNLLPSLYAGLEISIRTNNEKVLIHLLDEFKNEFGYEFDYDKGFKIIKKQIEFYRNKYEGLIIKKEKEDEKDKFDFEKMIIGIELNLGINIDRNFKVFQLKSYYEKAIENNKE